MRARSKSTGAGSVETMIVEVGSDLARAFSGVLDALPGAPHRPQWLARSLGVNTVLTSRLLKAAQQSDGLAVAHMIPGPEPLRRLLKAAERKDVDAALIRDARRAVERFERLIDTHAGDRSALDALISGWLPDARERVELLAKQAVFRGTSQLLGTACELDHHAVILYPARGDSGRADSVWLTVTRALRRVRPGLAHRYGTIHTSARLLTIAGEPADGLHGLLLEKFCSRPLPRMEVTHRADRAQYSLSGDRVGVQSAVNLVYASLLLAYKQTRRSPGEAPRMASIAMGIAVPSRTVVFDLLVHEEVYPGQRPALFLYRGTVGEGAADPNDRAGDVNRLDVIESVQPLGQGIAAFRSAETPDYQEMLRLVCAARGWDGERLRGFRCRVEYPMYSSQIVLAFDVPAADQGERKVRPGGISSRPRRRC